MIFNGSTLVAELLSHYFELWKFPLAHGVKAEDIESSRKENAKRCIMVTKWLFVEALSTIEYCMKETMNLYPNNRLAKWYHKEKQQKKRWIYLRSIIEKSNQIGIVNDGDYECWNCIRDVRNSIVHNNAIANQNKTYQVGGTAVSFIKGKMLRGKLDFFVKLTDKAIDLYYLWITIVIKQKN
jgi:hypothetical protein